MREFTDTMLIEVSMQCFQNFVCIWAFCTSHFFFLLWALFNSNKVNGNSIFYRMELIVPKKAKLLTKTGWVYGVQRWQTTHEGRRASVFYCDLLLLDSFTRLVNWPSLPCCSIDNCFCALVQLVIWVVCSVLCWCLQGLRAGYFVEHVGRAPKSQKRGVFSYIVVKAEN